MSLFSELKSRNVFRIAAAYIVVAWLVIQVVETIFPAFGFGDEAVRIVVIVLAIGLIPALVFSWLFEITPDGFKREADIDRSQPISTVAVKRLDRAIIIVLTLALGFFAFDRFVLDPVRDAEIESATAERVRTEVLVESYGESSIAVLPFANMSSEADSEYFSDGIAEELLSLLARIPRLRVISQSSSFSFKGKDITVPEVAERLNVAFVLEGSVRRAGNRVRITAQLIEARSDTHLWSESYERTLDDVFAIQDEISAAIVEALRSHLKLDIGVVPKVAVTENTEAHDAVLRGRYLIAQRTPESMLGAVTEFEKAVALDPDYALAHAELALAMFLSPPSDLTEQQYTLITTEHVEKALGLDPGLAEAYAAKAWLTADDMDGNESTTQAFRRALELNPNYALVYVWMANWGLASSPEEAFAFVEMSLRLDPLSRSANVNYIGALIPRNRLSEADRQLEKYTSIDPKGAIVLRGVRSSIGGNWANYVLAYLEAAKNGTGELLNSGSYFDYMLWHLDSMGLESEALQLADGHDSHDYVRFENPDDKISWAQEQLKQYPNYFETQIALGLAYVNAGRYAEARNHLEMHWQFISGHNIAWNWSETFANLEVAGIIVLRDAGDEVTAKQLLTQIRDMFRRFRDAGIVLTEWDKSVDYREGQAAYLAGEHDAGLALMSKAADDGYWIQPPATYHFSMHQDPGFVAILEKQKVRQVRERDKVLTVVCNNNPYAAVWQPTEETCQLLNQSGR